MPRKKFRKMRSRISLITVGEASGEKVLEAPRKKFEICCCIE